MTALARPRDTSLAFPDLMIRGFLREAREPGTGKSQHRVPVSPATCEVLGSRGTAKSPAWAGLKFNQAAAWTKCPISGCPRPHLAVPWVHPEDEARGMEADAIYRVDPIWSVGDHIWVREAFATGRADHLWGPTVYRATHTAMAPVCEGFTPWRSARQMPRELSRLTLLVTEVRVEKLQSISEADCDAEIFGGDFPHAVMPELFDERAGDLSIRECFARVWNSLHGPDAWATNPWCCVSALRPILANIDALPAADLGREARS